MIRLTLAKRIFLVSCFAFILFGGVNFFVLYRAQSELVLNEMDRLLQSQALTLSALVSSKSPKNFDFEVSPYLVSHFSESNSPGFFRFLVAGNPVALRQSTSAPGLLCDSKISRNNFNFEYANQRFRVKQFIFEPDIDDEVKNLPPFPKSSICLLVGISKEPYLELVQQTLTQGALWILTLGLVLVACLSFLIRKLTLDLSNLTEALAIADFGATHEFPPLPISQTQEVQAVVEKLSKLHGQAADVYREMWLFLGRAAHQLKTPVTAIQSTLEVLLRRDRSKEELLAGLADVSGAVNHLALLSRNLIASSRNSYQDTPEHEAVSLNSIFAELFKIFESQAASRNVILKLDSSEDLFVFGSKVLLLELFGNLIENSILYSPLNQNAEIRVQWKLQKEIVEVRVRDHGFGFPQSVQESLFLPFVRGDERVAPGSGLGLSIARKLARSLKGELVLEATGPDGSLILVTLLSSKS